MAASSKSVKGKGRSDDAPVPTSRFQEYLPKLQQALAQATEHAQKLPDGSDLKFHRSLSKDFAKELDASAARLLKLSTDLANLPGSSKTYGKGKGKVQVSDADSMVEDFERHLQETLDKLLERADYELDMHTGRQKKAAIEIREAKQRQAMRPLPPDHTPTTARLAYNLLHAKDLAKPQLLFNPPVDNYAEAGPSWSTLLPVKQHAVVPADWQPVEGSADDLSLKNLLERGRSPQTAVNPYAYETVHLQYPNSLFDDSPPIPPVPFATTPFTFVDTPELLQAMVDKLLVAREIAVDLEHNSFRSYGGIVCLMQISTREEDWVVDTLVLRKELIDHKLGGVLVDPRIVKVFHGAESDITWLQQNFGMFVVGLFDTYHATKVLDFPSHSLASLLSLYCDFTADKRYQTADWRIRPLPEEMLYYARTDTHYLLYVYDQLRNALLARSQGTQDHVREVLARSAATALKVYENEAYDAETGAGTFGWLGLAKKAFGMRRAPAPDGGRAPTMLVWGHGQTGLQVELVFKRLHEWRDKVAREIDESTGYILPNSQLAPLARWAPQSRAALTSALNNPTAYPIVQERADELVAVIAQASQDAKAVWEQREASASGANVSAAVVEAVESAPPSGAATPVAEIETMEVDVPAQEAPTLAAPVLSSLWSAVTAPVKKLSGLFGGTVPTTSHPRTTSARPHSAMFGQTFGDRKYTNGRAQHTADQSYLAVLASLARPEAPPAPQPAVQDSAPPEPVVASAPLQPEQVPYVRPEARETKKAPDANDVVVVGRQNKKRKKEKAATEDDAALVPGSANKKAARVPVKPEDIPEFSYANEPNQLDTFPEDQSVKVKKQKKVKKPIVDTSKFRKPPQDPSAPQAGNRSRTFK